MNSSLTAKKSRFIYRTLMALHLIALVPSLIYSSNLVVILAWAGSSDRQWFVDLLLFTAVACPIYLTLGMFGGYSAASRGDVRAGTRRLLISALTFSAVAITQAALVVSS